MTESIECVILHPPVAALYTATEHAAGERQHLGDALGVDCVVVRLVDGWVRPYDNDGAATPSRGSPSRVRSTTW